MPSLDLPAGDLLPGIWRVELQGTQGLIASHDQAFLVAAPPTVTGIDDAVVCGAAPDRPSPTWWRQTAT